MSRSLVNNRDNTTETDVACYVNAITHSWPISQQKLDRIWSATQEDEQLQSVQKLIKDGWTERVTSITNSAKDYYTMKHSLSLCEGLVTVGCRIVIPQSMRQEILERLHDGHQRLSKCRERAKEAVWWPNISADIKQRVETCHFCQLNKRAQRKEPLQPTLLPERPWQEIATDLCEYKGKQYIVISDYYSHYLEILHLPSTTTDQVVKLLKATYARFGIPDKIVSDKCPQFTSETWKDFCRKYDIVHVISSPHNPQGKLQNASTVSINVLQSDTSDLYWCKPSWITHGMENQDHPAFTQAESGP